MNSLVLIGMGAGGNKGALHCVNGGYPKEKVLLINSTSKDIPADCGVKTYIYQDTIGGCGKETALAINMIENALWVTKDLPPILEQLIDLENDDQVVIVAGCEGGTGCGGAPVLADFIRTVFDIPVTVIGINGFQSDVRGLANTIEFYKKMKPEFAVQSICNAKFLDGAMNEQKAEQKANDELLMRIQALTGYGLVDSEQNIDPTDLYKVATSPGYTLIFKASLDGIKNTDQFNQLLTKMFDENKSMDSNRKSTKLGYVAVMINAANEDIMSSIDEQFAVIKERFGEWYELYKHKQYEEDQPNSITIILQGLDMPSDEINEIYKKYQERSSAVDKSEDSFFAESKNMIGNTEDSRFNRGVRRRRGGMGSLEDKINAYAKKRTNTEVEPNNQEKDNFIQKI